MTTLTDIPSDIATAAQVASLRDVTAVQAGDVVAKDRAIVARLMDSLRPFAGPGSTFSLMAAHGVYPLSADAGFTARPTADPGAGMTLFPMRPFGRSRTN